MLETVKPLQLLVALFLCLESANVLALYFSPGSKMFNAVGVFQGWEDSKRDEPLHAFVRYLVNWIAGTKLIFIALWLVILTTAGPRTQLFASVVMIPAITTFYWRLFPIVRDLDRRGHVRPSGYSKVLGWMIAGFIIAFCVAVVTALP